ncbi:MAG: hypothetical protein K8T89_18850 [Planctomycetes bacterium]|nr:hypothetical protein [Planctomycetota bacterium]
MQSTMNRVELQKARQSWNRGEALEAGKLIYEVVPLRVRPRWASNALQLVLNRSGVRASLFDLVMTVANQEDLWESGHRVFSMVRKSTLHSDECRRTRGLSTEEELFASILSLAELVSKVTYNATDPPDEFDVDSGWWIAASLRGFMNHRWQDDEFADAAWATLITF